jgi:hypothetical protein
MIAPHKIFLALGFFFYLVAPPMLGAFRFQEDSDLMQIFLGYFKIFEIEFGLFKYFFVLIGVAISLILGIFFGSIIPLFSPKKIWGKYVERFSSIFLGIWGFLAILILAIIVPPSFSAFADYQQRLFGVLLTGQTILTFFAVLSTSLGRRWVPRLLAFTVMCIAFYLMVSGVRMGLINAASAWLAYRLFSGNNFPVFRIALVPIFAVIVGVLRVGTELSVGTLIVYASAEFLFTWISVATMFSNSIDYLEAPWPLISSLYNFVPSFLWPEKSASIISISENISFQSPFGATSFLVTSVGNFGWIFFGIYGFIVSSIAQYVYRLAQKNYIACSYYICICSILPFQLFRDGSGILLKQLLWNSLFLPIMIIGIIWLPLYILPKKKATIG